MSGVASSEQSVTQQRQKPSAVRRAGALLLVLAVCAGLRVWLIARMELIAADGTIYIRMARDWAAGPRAVAETYDYHVGYPALIAAAHRAVVFLGGPEGLAGWDLAGQVVSLVAALAALAGVYVFAAMAFDRRIALVAVLLFGLGRKWAVLGADVLSDAPAVCLQVWAVVLAVWTVRLLERGKWSAVGLAAAVGLCAGGAYLVRPEALLVAAVAAAVWLVWVLGRRAKFGITLAAMAAMALTAIACALPYMLAIGGISKKKHLADLLPGLSGAAGGGGILAAACPGSCAVLKVLAQLSEAIHPMLAILVVVWVVTWLCARVIHLKLPECVRVFPSRTGGVVMIAAAAVVLPMAAGLYIGAGYVSHRHMMFLAAVLSPLAGAGVFILAGWVATITARLRKVPASPGIPALAIAVLMAATLLVHASVPPHQDKRCYREAAEFVRDRTGPADYVATDDPWIFHYAERPGHVIPDKDNTPTGVVGFVRRTPTTWLVLTDEVMALGRLPRGADASVTLRPVRVFTTRHGKRTSEAHVFQVLRERPTSTSAPHVATERLDR